MELLPGMWFTRPGRYDGRGEPRTAPLSINLDAALPIALEGFERHRRQGTAMPWLNVGEMYGRKTGGHLLAAERWTGGDMRRERAIPTGTQFRVPGNEFVISGGDANI